MEGKAETLNQMRPKVIEQMTLGSPSAARELSKRRRRVEICIEKQRTLCELLDEPMRPLSVDPLATDLEIAAFCKHVGDLMSMVSSRAFQINFLKYEIESVCYESDVDTSYSVMTE